MSVASLALGFAREATIAYFFGTCQELDAFLIGMALPSLLVVNVASITVAVVLPVYVAHREAGRLADATALVQKWFWFSALVIAGICLAIFCAAGPLMKAMAAGFGPAQQARAGHWLRTMLPYVWLLAMVGIFKTILNSNDRFAVPAMTNQLVALGVIVSCVAGAQKLGVGALVVGFGGGAVVAFGWQWANARRFEPKLVSLAGIRRNVSIPMAAGGAMALHSLALQVDVAVDRAFASTLPHGSVAAYNYAQRVNAMPSAIITSVLATVLFPVLARMTAAGKWREALRTVSRWCTALVLLGLVPVLLLVMFRFQLISVVFHRGAFDEAAVRLTAEPLCFLPFSILISSASTLFSQLLLAQRRARAVALLSMLVISLKFLLNLVFVRSYGLAGLALATVVASAVVTTLRIIVASRYGPAGGNQ